MHLQDISTHDTGRVEYTKKDFNYLCHVSVRNDIYCKDIFMLPVKYLPCQVLNDCNHLPMYLPEFS